MTTLVVPSVYLLIGGFSRPANYTANLLDRLRKQEAIAGRGHMAHGEHGSSHAVEPAE
jgi:multidrug efflux pump